MNRAGFTLMEMLIVVVIIGMLAGVITANVMGQMETVRIKTTTAQAVEIKTAIRSFELALGRLPKHLEELVATGGPEWPGPFLEDETVPKDAWNIEFRFGVKNKRLRVSSAGPDGRFETDDDIVK